MWVLTVYTDKIRKRFDSHWMPEPNTGCHLWLASCKVKNGVSWAGFFGINRRNRIASRVAWEMANGPIANGLSVLHRCDTPSCVNPAHLFLGTQAENMADMDKKGRRALGERHGSTRHPFRRTAKLDPDKVRAIRAAHAAGVSQLELSRQYGVDTGTMCRAVNRQQWKHVI